MRELLVRPLLCYMLVISLLTSCARQHVSTPVPSVPAPRPSQPTPGLGVQYGLASWYGRERHGRRTASGEIYDSTQLTAAHRQAPFGTYAQVTNLDNGRTVRVRINDRGPAIAQRVLDLSYTAAHQLDMLRAGLAYVKIEFLPPGHAWSAFP